MSTRVNRRQFLVGAAAAGLMLKVPALRAAPGGNPAIRTIPATGEAVPAIGMGTWRTFNVGSDAQLIAQRTQVLSAFFELGGTVVDSSPMYGSSEAVLGKALDTLNAREQVFSATKIWTGNEDEGREQAEASLRKWGLARFDLLQIHNLLGWRGHLETLKQMKADGDVRYIGITTSHGRRHSEFERLMAEEPLDFVQLTYNIRNREVERRLLPLARDRGIAVIANRPFEGGNLFRRFESESLPAWAAEAGCSNWAEFFLKFIVSHPAITCAIPATTRVDHMRENMGALYGPMPNAEQRELMVQYVGEL